MSYVKARERVEGAPKIEHDKTRCRAYGCPCRASVNAGDGWLCRYHAHAAQDKWQDVTRLVRENDWLIGFIGEVQKMANERKPWREFAERFWDSDPDGKPERFEEPSAYLYRMEREMLWRCGQSQKRPVAASPRVKLAEFLKGVRIMEAA